MKVVFCHKPYGQDNFQLRTLKLKFSNHKRWTIFPFALLIFSLSCFGDSWYACSVEIEYPIHFMKGKSFASLNGALLSGEKQLYALSARAGQVMNVKLFAVADNGIVQIIGPDKQYLLGARETDGAKQWSGLLPVTGKYTIVVDGRRGDIAFSLNVWIDSENIDGLKEVNSDMLSLDRFMTSDNDNKHLDYVVAFRDLDGDGKNEAIVHLTGSDYCGSGGCNTLILKRNADSWKIVTSMTITHPPIRVLENVVHGWHSIAVFVAGGGILPGYEAELAFNGKTYPSNPSTVLAKKSSKRANGDVVIPNPVLRN